ncbi:uncharacterized protein LOC127245377 [Andrographis paniculata]|uniref:uncharacterized protein LOC127245377 n=1 Tax=Andrographis paniculata TaxID=175694 RepID=UPI0021E81EDF|nr:uncharacterized protein LOC127245377 [Andrographis paniculata]
MNIPEMNMISDFEAGMNCLQNPSFISRFLSFPAQQLYITGALLFAIFATFSSLVRRLKILLIHFHILKSSSHHHKEDHTLDYSEDDEISLATSDDDEQEDGDHDEQEEDEDNHPTTTSSRGQRGVDEDFRVKNPRLPFKNQWPNGHLRQRRRRSNCSAWSEFTSGKNVVKLWDSLGFNLDFDEDLFDYDPQSVVSTWESDRFQNEKEASGGVWNIPAAAPAVLLTAEGNGKGDRVILSGYDSRMRGCVPALYADWSSPAEKLAGVSTGGVGKVFIRDDAGGVHTVGDVRNVRRALESVKESDGDTWWDADAVIVDETEI